MTFCAPARISAHPHLPIANRAYRRRLSLIISEDQEMITVSSLRVDCRHARKRQHHHARKTIARHRRGQDLEYVENAGEECLWFMVRRVGSLGDRKCEPDSCPS